MRKGFDNTDDDWIVHVTNLFFPCLQPRWWWRQHPRFRSQNWGIGCFEGNYRFWTTDLCASHCRLSRAHSASSILHIHPHGTDRAWSKSSLPKNYHSTRISQGGTCVGRCIEWCFFWPGHARVGKGQNIWRTFRGSIDVSMSYHSADDRTSMFTTRFKLFCILTTAFSW